MTMTLSEKSTLRAQLRKARQNLMQVYRKQAEQSIARYIYRLLRPNLRLAVYQAYGSEINLEYIVKRAYVRRVEIYFPKIPPKGRRLWFTRWQPKLKSRAHSRYKIEEFEGLLKRAEHLDVILLPLIGVDADGFRLGQGGGFYDTSLARIQSNTSVRRPKLIGVAFDCQKVERVPRDCWDLPLDGLLTESGLVWFKNKK